MAGVTNAETFKAVITAAASHYQFVQRHKMLKYKPQFHPNKRTFVVLCVCVLVMEKLYVWWGNV